MISQRFSQFGHLSPRPPRLVPVFSGGGGLEKIEKHQTRPPVCDPEIMILYHFSNLR